MRLTLKANPDCSPRVSVIIPTFNRSGYLYVAIASVLAQTYPDFEIVVVDDGSTDDTATVVARFDDPRIRYVHQANAGRSAARNRALALTRSEYIAFLDDDDLYLPDKLTVQVAFLDAHREIGLVASDAKLIAADGSLLAQQESRRDQIPLTLPGCLYACPLLTCGVLLRRHWLEALDQWFDPTIELAEDTDLWIRLLAAGCRMVWLPTVVCAYRQHAASSQHDGERYYQSYLRLLDKLYTRNDLHQAVLNERPALYAHYHILGACRAYADEQIDRGQARLMLAVEASPGLLKGMPPAIAVRVAGVAHSVASDAHALILRMFDALPVGLLYLRRWRRHTLSALYMQRIFVASANGAQPHLSDWVYGVRENPRWLANRGVWSILIQDLLLSSSKPGVRT